MSETRVESNLKKFLRRTTAPSAGCSKISLLQVMSSGGSNVLREIMLDSSFGYDETKIGEMVADLLSTAQEDADNQRGVTTFCLRSFKGITQYERSPLFRLRSQTNDFDDEALGDTEPATKDGHLAQLMRHNEVYARTLAQMFEVQSRQNTEEKRALLEEIRHYRDKHFEVMIQAEELANEKEERERGRLLMASQEKRKDQIMALLKPMVPIAMAKFKGTPDSAKPELWKEGIKQILADITPEKMEKLAEILGPHSLALAEIYMDAHKETDNESATPEPTGNPH